MSSSSFLEARASEEATEASKSVLKSSKGAERQSGLLYSLPSDGAKRRGADRYFNSNGKQASESAKLSQRKDE